MSGGYFDYIQDRMNAAAEELDDIAFNNPDGFNNETINKIIETAKIMDKAERMLRRVDWLVSCDDGEETFHERWKKDGIDDDIQ